MNVSTDWINAWLEKPLEDKVIVEALERAGVEVESYQPPRRLDERIVAVRVESVLQHPAADRLHLVDVTAGGGLIRVVCGAPNVRAGMYAALAQVGAVLPDGEQIGAAKLRGEMSHGMLCSERELGLGEDYNGILELAETGKLGQSVSDLYPAGGVVELKTQANRFDLLSVVGLAREVAAMTHTRLKDLPEPFAANLSQDKLVVDEPQALRLMFVKLSIQPQATLPQWLNDRLKASGVRSINPIVDVTNYVNLELGQPLHAYDAKKVQLPLVVRKSNVGEKITTLDGVSRSLAAQDLVVADAGGPVALAGVMGGQSTEVDAETREVILEAAVFDAATVRKM